MQRGRDTAAVYEMMPYGKGGKREEALRKEIKRKKQVPIIFRNECVLFGCPPKI